MPVYTSLPSVLTNAQNAIPDSVKEQVRKEQARNKNTGIGGIFKDILGTVVGAGTGSSVGELETIVEIDEKPDYTIYYIFAGVVVLLGGIYFFTKKKK